MMTYIFKRVKIQGSRGATHCITGWQLSISAVIVLWNDVKSVCGVSNVQMILLSLPLLMSWVPLNLQLLTSIYTVNNIIHNLYIMHSTWNTVMAAHGECRNGILCLLYANTCV